jgi:hypothetical protein
MSPHIVHMHHDRGFLLDAVADYFETGARQGEIGIVIARPEFRETLTQRVPGLKMLDAERTLALFMVGDMPVWNRFHAVIGGLIAEMRLEHDGVRAYGEMVDILWQAGNKKGAIKLEEFWNELGRLQTFSLFCAYQLDSLEECACGGAMDSISRVHTHLTPARDPSSVDAEVSRAIEQVVQQPLAAMLLALAADRRIGARMPIGQAALLWLSRNMPHTGEQVLTRVRAALAPRPA